MAVAARSKSRWHRTCVSIWRSCAGHSTHERLIDMVSGTDGNLKLCGGKVVVKSEYKGKTGEAEEKPGSIIEKGKALRSIFFIV